MDIEEKDSLVKLLNSVDKRVFRLGLSLLSKEVKREEFLQFIIRYSFFKDTESYTIIKSKRDVRFIDENDYKFLEYLDINSIIINKIGLGLNKYSLREMLKIIIDNIYDNS